MFAERTFTSHSRGGIEAMNSVFLPDLQIIADLNDEIFSAKSVKEKTQARTVDKEKKVVPVDRFVGLVAQMPVSEGENLTDRIVSNAFQQCFCNELFDLLGGFVC